MLFLELPEVYQDWNKTKPKPTQFIYPRTSVAKRILYICQVKILASLLIVLFVSLSVAPCADGAEHQHHEADASTAEHHNHDHDGSHNHDGESDECSPLCYCNCCHTSVILTVQYFKWPAIQPSQVYINTYQGHKSEAHFNSLFRPPIG